MALAAGTMWTLYESGTTSFGKQQGVAFRGDAAYEKFAQKMVIIPNSNTLYILHTSITDISRGLNYCTTRYNFVIEVVHRELHLLASLV